MTYPKIFAAPRIFVTIAAAATCAATLAGAESLAWTRAGFDMPESAVFDSARNRIVLSVIGGAPDAADGDGSLALLSAEGEVIDPAWVTGLDAPKGMAILGGTLLVADLTRLHEIDLETGKHLRSLEPEGAAFLNDIAADGTRAFVSDFMSDSLWLYEGGTMRPWLEDAALSHPNGLLVDGERLLVGSWGQGMQADFSTQAPGSLLAVDLVTQEISVLAGPLGNLDGIARIGGALLVSDWITGQLFGIGPDGAVAVAGQYAAGLADISAAGDMLLLPSMLEGTLSARPYP